MGSVTNVAEHGGPSAATVIAPGTPIGNLGRGTGDFTSLSTTLGLTSTANWGSQAKFGTTGQSGRIDFIGGVTGVSKAYIGFDSAATEGTLQFIADRGMFKIAGLEVLNLRELNGGSLAVGAFAPSAKLHIGAGAAAAGRAPLKFTSGPLNTTPEPGGEEFLTNDRYYTGTDGVRRRYAVNGQVITLRGFTVATLPAGTEGDRAYVTDASAPTYNGALTGGGTVKVPVFFNGAAWVSA